MTDEVKVERKLMHTREVVCRGYLRSDGLWDVEGALRDVRACDVLTREREVLVKAGETLHGMRLRMTVDASFRIVDAQAHTEHGPHSECGAVDAGYSSLRGMVIGPGFMATVKQQFGGTRGCTHLTELIGAVVTTAIQTILSTREQQGSSLQQGRAGGGSVRLVDSCYAWRRGGEAFNAH